MTEKQTAVVTAILIASILIFVGALVWAIIGFLKRKFSKEIYNKPGVSRTIIISACLIISMVLFRYALELYAMTVSGEDTLILSWWQELFNATFLTLDAFDGDIDYASYIMTFRSMLREIIGYREGIETVLVLYASALEMLAPVLGGAIFFEILANVFPKIKLFFASLGRREIYYFSELNEASLALAKSIYSHTKRRIFTPYIVFTDAYADNEASTELLNGAKPIGAICVKDDLTHLAKKRFGKKNYFLTDTSELKNLQVLISLSDKQNCKYIKNAKIYVFLESSLYAQVEKQFCEKLEAGGFKNNERPTVIPVQIYRNLVSNLLTEVPLYEPVVSKKVSLSKGQSIDLTVTIFGSGLIGTEMFLGVYWIGQMLDCRLNINVVSQDSKEEFWSKIDYINPEIRKTVKTAESGDKKDGILKYNDRDFSDYYAAVNYKQVDVKSDAFWKMKDDTESVLDSDYYMVALGSDKDNLSVAEMLRKCVGEGHVEASNGRKSVIAYVVYDKKLCDTLNSKKRICTSQKGRADIYMHAFGSLEDVYSAETVMMTRHSVWAKQAGDTYSVSQIKSDNIAENKARAQNSERNYFDEDYKYWANLAKAMHMKYKVFSLGWITASVFDDGIDYSSHVNEACSRYRRIAIDRLADGDAVWKEKLDAVRDELAWLEHRRWNAFTRVMGFRGTDRYGEYFGVTGSYKNMDLKLHPCLVECDKSGIRENTLVETDESKTAEFDYLDRLSNDLYKKRTVTDENGKKTEIQYNSYDFKEYDYYKYEFGKFYSVSEAAELLNISLRKIKRLCKKGCFEGTVKFEGDSEWMIHEKTIKDILKERKAKAEKSISK